MPGGSSHHEAGGLALGEDPDNSVADSYGRIRGVEGLYAFDSSTWPDVPPANPHLTIVALARRQALALAAQF
jgi:choline dehydrogenase-like flavoprotein